MLLNYSYHYFRPGLARRERAAPVASSSQVEGVSLFSTHAPTVTFLPTHLDTPHATTRLEVTPAPEKTLRLPAPSRTVRIVTFSTPATRAIPTPTPRTTYWSMTSSIMSSHATPSSPIVFATPPTFQSFATPLDSVAFGTSSEPIPQPSPTPPTPTAHRTTDPRVVYGAVLTSVVVILLIVFILWVLRRRARIRRRPRQGQLRASTQAHIRPYGSRAARVPPSVGRVEHALEKLRALGHSSKETQPVDPLSSHVEGAATRDVERGEPNGSNDAANRLVNEIRELSHHDGAGHETGSAILLELEDAVRDAGLSVDVLLASLRRVNQRVEGAESEVGSALPPIYMHSEPGEVQ